jgi:hypothetical protein
MAGGSGDNGKSDQGGKEMRNMNGKKYGEP